MPNDLHKLYLKVLKLNSFLHNDAKHIVGNVAVNFAQEQFQNEGFTDNGFEPWSEVNRRRITSPWYGFQYGVNKKNFSPAATQRKILTGSTGNLGDSTYYTVSARGVRIKNRMPYAGVQNNGGKIKVFKRHTVKLKARKFIGASRELDRRIVQALSPEIRKILNS